MESLPEAIMRKTFALLFISVLMLTSATAQDREEDRLKSAGEVLKEILDIPDNIPQDLMDKAECVVVLPSVKKLAIGIGGSAGKGAMTCRTGEAFTGGW